MIGLVLNKKYELIEYIGKGGFGKVYKAKRNSDNKFFALKLIIKDEFNSSEIDIHQLKLNNPNLVEYEEEFEESLSENFKCLVIQYCDDGDLRKLMNRNVKFNFSLIIKWSKQIIDGLLFLHENNIVHRDLKPENIFVLNENVKIGDFGISLLMNANSARFSMAGTDNYMSPEMKAYKGYNSKTDIWSFGCVLFELITFIKFNTYINNLANEIYLEELLVNEKLDKLLRKMLINDPNQRPNSSYFKKKLEAIDENSDDVSIKMKDWPVDFNKLATSFFEKRIKYLIQRKDILIEIGTLFKVQNIVVACSQAGTGKSTLANEYANEFVNESTNNFVYQLNLEQNEYFAQNENKLLHELREFSRKIPGITINKNDTIQMIVLRLKNHFRINLDSKTKILFIFDNCETKENLNDCLELASRNVNILITTRNEYLLSNKDFLFSKIEIKSFNYEESLEYLKFNLNINNNEYYLLERLLQNDCEYRPYVLQKLVANLKSNSNSIKDIIESNANKLNDLLTDQHLFQTLIDKNQQAFELLKFTAYLDPNFIPRDLLLDLMNIDKKQLEVLVKFLKESSLIKIENKRETGIKINRSLQSELLKFLKFDENLFIYERFVDIINDLFVESDSKLKNRLYYYCIKNIFELLLDKKLNEVEFLYARYARFNELWSNYSLSLKYYEKCLEFNTNLLSYLNSIGNIYSDLNEYEKALDYFKKSLDQIKEDFKSENSATVLTNISNVYFEQAHYDKSLEYLNKCLNIYQLNENKLQIANVLDRIASIFYEKSNYNEALDYFKEAHKIVHELYPNDNHELVATILNGTGLVYQELDQFEEAFNSYDRALKVYRKLYNVKDYIRVADILNNIAIIFRFEREYEKALEYNFKSLDMTRKILENNDNHDSIASSLQNIGQTYLDLNENEKALNYFEECYKIVKHVHGQLDYHPRIASALFSIGLAYSKMKDNTKEIDYYLKSKVIYENLIEKSSTDMADLLCNLGLAYFKQNVFDLASDYLMHSLKIYRDVYKNDSNSRIADVLSNISILYAQQEKYDESLVYSNEAIEINLKIKNKNQNHNLAENYSNLGLVYILMENYSEALVYFDKALNLTKDNDITAIVKLNMADMYFKLGDYEKSIEYSLESLNLFQILGDDVNSRKCNLCIKFSQAFKKLTTSAFLNDEEIKQFKSVTLKILSNSRNNLQSVINNESLSENVKFLFSCLLCSLDSNDGDDDENDRDIDDEDDENSNDDANEDDENSNDDANDNNEL